MTHGETAGGEPIETLLQQVDVANQHGLHVLALYGAITIPDICGALEGKPPGPTGYASWFEQNMPARYHQPIVHRPRLRPEPEEPVLYPKMGEPPPLSGLDAYYLRCKLLHEFETRHQQRHERAIRFVQHDALLITDTSAGGKEVQLNQQRLCSDLVGAARAWLERTANESTIQANKKRSLALYPDGLGGVKNMPVRA